MSDGEWWQYLTMYDYCAVLADRQDFVDEHVLCDVEIIWFLCVS